MNMLSIVQPYKDGEMTKNNRKSIELLYKKI